MNMHINMANEYGSLFARLSNVNAKIFVARFAPDRARTFFAEGRNFVCGQGHRDVRRNSAGTCPNSLKSANNRNNVQNASMGFI